MTRKGDNQPNWGQIQRSPVAEEHNYHIFGRPPSKKQEKARQQEMNAGKLTSTFASKKIRNVGMLKFLRNIWTHRAQIIEAGRFESEDAVAHYLLDPFPWLLIEVYVADVQYGLTALFVDDTKDAHAGGVDEAMTMTDFGANFGANKYNMLEGGGRPFLHCACLGPHSLGPYEHRTRSMITRRV